MWFRCLALPSASVVACYLYRDLAKSEEVDGSTRAEHHFTLARINSPIHSNMGSHSNMEWQVAVAAIDRLDIVRWLGFVAPLDRDEPRNAQCTAEMLAAGDWVVPTFNGQLRTHKPILLYWMQGLRTYSLVPTLGVLDCHQL